MSGNKIIDFLSSFHDLSKAINSSLNVDEVVDMTLKTTARLIQSNKVLILILDKKESLLKLHSSLGFNEKDIPVKSFNNVKPFDHCIINKGSIVKMEKILPEDEYSAIIVKMPLLADMIFAPLEIQGEAYGLLGVSGTGRILSSAELEILCTLGSQVAVAMENANLYRRLKNAFVHTAEALAEAILSRDPYTGGHIRRVEEYSLEIAESLDLPDKDKEDLRLAAILHDIGKIGIDDAILRKGSNLSAVEKRTMKQHPEIGARILSCVHEMVDVIPAVKHHHERFDGSGYPDGLKGEAIPLSARIIAIADTFDAITSDRPYKKGIARKKALELLVNDKGALFDPFLVRLLSDAEQKKNHDEISKEHLV